MAATGNQLVDLFFEHRGKTIDKWEHYLSIYAREFAPFLTLRRPVRLLEIGVQNGGSLELWAKYLPEGSEIIGVDVDPKVGSLTFEGTVSAYVVDATDSSKLSDALGDKRFDVILDDGSHISSDVITSFRLLFDRLALGGKFIIEDMHASYWASLEGGYRLGTSAIELRRTVALSAASSPTLLIRLSGLWHSLRSKLAPCYLQMSRSGISKNRYLRDLRTNLTRKQPSMRARCRASRPKRRS